MIKNIFLFSLGAISCLILSTTFRKQDEPEKIISQSTLSNVLLANCANEIMFNLPADAEINYSCTNATIIRTDQRNKIILRPDSSDVVVKLELTFNGRKYIQTYHSTDVPAPRISLICNGKPLDLKLGMAAPGPRQILVRADADPFVSTFFPIDSKYFITEWNAILVRGKRPIAQQRFTMGNGNITAFAAQAQPGDRLLIEVASIQRVNFQGKRESVPCNNLYYNMPIN